MERIKLTAAAKNQLITLKRRTGIEHNNAICRHALCLSLANPSVPPDETFSFGGGIEIDWRTLTGGQDALYHNLLVVRLLADDRQVTEDSIRHTFVQHVHRGLSYLASRREEDLLVELAKSIDIGTSA
ncbi:DNA sulfur modification protein DndE [Comamonas thiooxydans]|uniref:DNA sulfur modification protein DndE n=1 Tax=Comamonas thiooxydans TaxID=363952 RepID=UPI00050F1908|nr:DNA sulfur modification protein DndE [Comamonas thiooxydans]KGG85574.1 DNA sulfur modification protein DndE [Comamonas thiooxydans]